MEIVGHMVLVGFVGEDDGTDVVEAAAGQLFDWVNSMPLLPGDEVVVIRGRE